MSSLDHLSPRLRVVLNAYKSLFVDQLLLLMWHFREWNEKLQPFYVSRVYYSKSVQIQYGCVKTQLQQRGGLLLQCSFS